MSSNIMGSIVPDREKIDAHLAKLRSQPSFYERYPGALISDPDPSDEDEEPRYFGKFYRTLSRKERELYYKQVYESDGFDVQEFPGAVDFGLIIPGDPDDDEDRIRVRRYANLAIKQHNENHGENLELVGIVKWNFEGACPVNYYITVKAKAKDADSADEEGTYQAKVNSKLLEEDTFVSIPLRRARNANKRKEPPSGSGADGADDESEKPSASSTHRHCC